jgi:predicted O-methyltransferase YrrM
MLKRVLRARYSKPYRFSRDFFTRCIPVWKDVLAPIRGKAGLHYLEVGVFEGASALWMLENVLTHRSSKLTCIDTFQGGTHARFRANLKLSGVSRKAAVVKGPSHEKLRGLPLDRFDVAYLDASGVAEDVLTNAVLTWDLVKVGGLLIFDDYRLWPQWPASYRPEKAVDAFLAVFKNGLDVVHADYQVIVRKTENEKKKMLHQIIRSGLCVSPR